MRAEFWMQCYISTERAMVGRVPAETISKYADDALAEFDKRFPKHKADDVAENMKTDMFNPSNGNIVGDKK